MEVRWYLDNQDLGFISVLISQKYLCFGDS
jgi:hypothetical protein